MASKSGNVTPQRFDVEPSEADLAVLQDPDGRSISLCIEDCAEQLTVSPRGVPMWFWLSCVCIPGGLGLAYVLLYRLPRGELNALDILAIPIFIAAIISLIAFGHFYNAQICSRGPFLVLDRRARTLWLPRADVRIDDSRLHSFVEVRAWYHEQFGRRETTTTWIAELTVLVREPDGTLVRCPVLACENAKATNRVAKMLSEFFGIEHRLIRASRTRSSSA
jgi:hypothetical protein